MRSQELTDVQLEMVKHLANGMMFHDIAIAMNCSDSNIHKQLGLARKKTQAKTLPHLVSIVIARGQLEWSAAGRVLNGSVEPPT
jgi:DNA-binding CsgD family transcriptional regulator